MPSQPRPAYDRAGNRLKKGGKPGWHCRVWDAKAGRQKQRTFYGTERDAHAYIASFRSDVQAAAAPTLPAAQYVTVAQWAPEFLRRYRWQVPPVEGGVPGILRPKTTWKNARANLEAYIIPGLGPDRRMVSVTLDDLTKMIGRLKVRDYTYTDAEKALPPAERPTRYKQAAPDTMDKAASITRLMFSEAHEAGIIGSDPSAKLRTHWGPTSRGRRVVIPSLRQVEQLADALDAAWPGRGDIVRVFAYTALRWESLAGLEWDDVDIEHRSIHVWRSRASSTGEDREGTKGGDDFYVTIIDEALEPLARLRAFADERGSNRVLTGERGGPLNYSLWRKHLDAARQASGVPYTAHRLRHVCISLMIAAGVPIEKVSEQAGHKTTQVTQRVYRHALAMDRRELAKLLRLPTTGIEVDESAEPGKGKEAA